MKAVLLPILLHLFVGETFSVQLNIRQKKDNKDLQFWKESTDLKEAEKKRSPDPPDYIGPYGEYREAALEKQQVQAKADQAIHKEVTDEHHKQLKQSWVDRDEFLHEQGEAKEEGQKLYDGNGTDITAPKFVPPTQFIKKKDDVLLPRQQAHNFLQRDRKKQFVAHTSSEDDKAASVSVASAVDTNSEESAPGASVDASSDMYSGSATVKKSILNSNVGDDEISEINPTQSIAG